ncbi:TPA: hypothetical protein ACP53V_001845 [Neisseria meningitidis]
MKKALKWITLLILLFASYLYGFDVGFEKGQKCGKGNICLVSLFGTDDETEYNHVYIDLPESNPKDIKQ